MRIFSGNGGVSDENRTVGFVDVMFVVSVVWFLRDFMVTDSIILICYFVGY